MAGLNPEANCVEASVPAGAIPDEVSLGKRPCGSAVAGGLAGDWRKEKRPAGSPSVDGLAGVTAGGDSDDGVEDSLASAVLVVGLLDPGGGGLWWWEEVEEKELLGLGGQDGLGLGGPVKRRLRKKVLVERKRVRGEVAGGREEDEVGSRKKRAVTEDTEESGSQKGVRGLFPDPIME